MNRRLTLNKHITPIGDFPGTSHGQICASSCFRSHDSSTKANVTIIEELVNDTDESGVNVSVIPVMSQIIHHQSRIRFVGLCSQLKDNLQLSRMTWDVSQTSRLFWTVFMGVSDVSWKCFSLDLFIHRRVSDFARDGLREHFKEETAAFQPSSLLLLWWRKLSSYDLKKANASCLWSHVTIKHGECYSSERRALVRLTCLAWGKHIYHAL